MFWAIIATTFGCVLLFSASNHQLERQAHQAAYISQWQLATIGKIMGATSVILSAGLWCSLHGLFYGGVYVTLCVSLNYALLYVLKPNTLRLITTSVMLIGCSFIYTTASMVMPT